MRAVKENWITGVAAVVGLFLVAMTVLVGLGDPSTTSERIFGIGVMGLASAAFLTGLWGLRTGRLATLTSNAGIVVGAIGTLLWFWMVIPPALGLIVLVFGVARGGLARELQTVSA